MPRALKSLNSIEKIQPRTMIATFNGNPSATIICYSPTNVSEETDLYNELSSLVRCIPKYNVFIIVADMNAQISKNVNHKFSLHNLSNRNWEHLTNFAQENRLTCLNTKFQKRKEKLWTNTYANNTKALIDFIFINKKWNNSALNCEAYSSFDGVSSDHRIVTAKIRLSLRRKAAWITTIVHSDWSLLNNRDIRDKYTLTLHHHHHHHHHVVSLARISLTLSRHFSLSFIASGRSSGLHPVSSHSCWMYVRAGRPAFARPYVGVHRSTSRMSSSLLLQQCHACLVRLTWIVFVMGGRWPYSSCLVWCCCQDMFNIARSILV